MSRFNWLEYYGVKPLKTNNKNKVGVQERYACIEAAHQLGYPPSIIKKLKEAESDIEISNIMASARRGEYA